MTGARLVMLDMFMVSLAIPMLFHVGGELDMEINNNLPSLTYSI